MAQPVLQSSFNSGEWAPALNARVDLTKYHTGAALLRNFFVDYRGGATARPGTKFIYQSPTSDNIVRLIPFQASFAVSYVLEFGVSAGSGYIGFTSNGAQVMSGGVPYHINSPYTSAELAQVKFTQNVNTMILCHPNHPPYILTLISATNWTIAQITFGATIAAPTGLAASTTLAAGAVSYAYVITAVDANGQESDISAFAALGPITDIRTVPGSNTISWSAVAAASSYNIYRAEPSYAGAIPAGASFGFVGNQVGTHFQDSNITPDFSQGPPIALNPFSGAGVQSVIIGSPGAYAGSVAVPVVSFSGGGGTGAAAFATLSASVAVVAVNGVTYAVGDTINLPDGVVIQVNSVDGVGRIIVATIISGGSLVSGSTPANPVGQVFTSGSGSGATFNLTWIISSIQVTSPGTGYGTPPTVAISGAGGANATSTIGAPAQGNPTVPALFQQRLVLAGPTGNPQQFNMSQTGSIYNFDIHQPLLGSDAITGSLVSGQLNTIQSMLPQPQGLIILSDKGAWLLNGGSPGSAVGPLVVANTQAYNGASYPPPIAAGNDILYVQSKTSIVRNLVFNYYTQVYTGTDISVLSSHLFYGYQILEWCWAEEPFKLVWAVRNDGNLLTLTFLKEQELVAWAHSDTLGSFKSIASVTESVALGAVDAVYVAVQRVRDGATLTYIERFTELYYPNDVSDAWCVDAGIGYSGAPATHFTGAQHLSDMVVTGLADGVVIPAFTMAASGAFDLATPASKVVVGLAYTPQLQTLALDLGEPTVQGKRKKITGVTTRVAQTLGLEIGRTFGTLTPMKDLIVGSVGTMTNAVVTGLVTGDARTIIDPLWDVPGQYCIQQSSPFPASILGVIPEITIGDTK